MSDDAAALTVTERPLKGRIEALLFLTAQALSLSELAEQLQASRDDVEEAMGELLQDYAFRGEESALEINDEDGYILQVKADYSDLVRTMVPISLSTAVLRTLAVIAIQGPLLQSDLVNRRGASAYDHIAELLEEKLIAKHREGRSYRLSVTPRFHELFRLAADREALEVLIVAEEVAANAPVRASVDDIEDAIPEEVVS